MRNTLLLLLVIGCLILTPRLLTPAFADIDFQQQGRAETGSQKILIVVNSDIYEVIKDSKEFNQWLSDLSAMNYSFRLATAESPSGTSQQLRDYARELKDELIISNLNDGIEGVILIGDLPFAQFEMIEDFRGKFDFNPSGGYVRFPIDLFYTDIDGIWLDTDNDGFYDTHQKGTGDLEPEIWLGRLTASLLHDPKMTESGLLKNYFIKNHNYRTGTMLTKDKQPINHRGLAYSDDDFSHYAGCDLDKAYKDVKIINEPAITTATDYKNRLSENYEWMHLSAHSGPISHFFEVNNGYEMLMVFSEDIRLLDPSTLFYNLFACSTCRWTVPDYIGGYYTFANTNGLVTIGSTKTGSMYHYELFYPQLGPNNRKNIGSAFRLWMDGIGLIDIKNRSQFYGMTILGDPTLSLDSPIASIEYIPAQAKPGEKVTFRGSGKIRQGNIAEYSWRSSIDGFLSNSNPFSTKNLSPGVHKIYFKVKDDKGRWSLEEVKFVYVSEAVFNIELKAGDNLISLPLIPYNKQISSVLAPIEGQYNSIWTYDIVNSWRVYLADCPDGSDLINIEEGKGYWIMGVKKDIALTIVGQKISNTGIPISKGWNLVGYNLLRKKTIEEAMSSITGKYSGVWAYDNVYKVWLIYSPDNSSSFKLIKEMVPGLGYWIYGSQNCIWDIEQPLRPVETPWKSNENGTLYTNIRWKNYTMGYRFTPLKNGKITKIGGFFNGTKSVYLWSARNRSVKENLLVATQVTSNNNWSYSSIAPLEVKAGESYIVAVYLGGSGGSYRQIDDVTKKFPQTYKNIRIETSCYQYRNSYPTSNISYLMMGQVDIEFIPN